MQQIDKIKQYTNSVCDQIRWKNAHTTISTELENHIIDQKNAFLNEGFDEITSMDKAIEEMGDPVIVGAQLDRTYKPNIEWSMIILTISLLSIGLAISFFIVRGISGLSDLFYFNRSIASGIIGIACMIIAYYADFTIIGKYPKLIFSFLIILMTILGFFTYEINGAQQWIQIPLIGSFSVSLFMLIFPTSYAGVIYNMRSKGYLGIILCGVFYTIPAFIFIIIYSGSLSSVLIYTFSCFLLLCISIFKGWFNIKRLYGMLVVIIPSVIISVLLLIVIYNSSGYRAYRLKAILNHDLESYIILVIKDMLNGAKFFGQGVLTMPETSISNSWSITLKFDYIITYLIHRVGWIAFIVILSVLTAFIIRGFYLCSKQKSVLGRLVSTSVLCTFTIQTVTYLSANLGFQLFSQLSLPLISYNRTATITNLILIGFMLSVFKSGYLLRDNNIKKEISKNKTFEFVDGKIIIDLKLKNTKR